MKIGKIKSLLLKLRKEEQVVEELKNTVSDINIDIKATQHKISGLKDKIGKLENNGSIRISDHAIVRYLERIQGVDIAQAKRDILTDIVLDQYNTLGDGTYPNKNFKIIIRNSTVTTIIIDEK